MLAVIVQSACPAIDARVVCDITTCAFSPKQLDELLASPYADDEIACGLNSVIVNIDGSEECVEDPGSLPVVVIAIVEPGYRPNNPSPFDVIIDGDDPALESLVSNIERNPIAATAAAVLLRGSLQLSVEDALAAESAVYSVLQSGAEFAAWRNDNTARPGSDEDGPAIITERAGAELHITLNRPHRHNAFSRSMRDALTEALALAVVDNTIERVHLAGRGPSFCSGGDLAEFGSFDDPATSHRTRLTRSPARLMHRIRSRTEVRLHGACFGAGIELPAFAHRVSADADTIMALPELSIGLVPGAGGTVSISRRIGRHRTAYMALSGINVSAVLALRWGLIDSIRQPTGGDDDASATYQA